MNCTRSITMDTSSNTFPLPLLSFQPTFPKEMKKMILTALLLLVAAGAFCQQKSKTVPVDTARNTGDVANTAFLMHYDDVFRHNADGSVSPVQPLQINGEMVNTSTRIVNGERYGGVELAAYAHYDMLVDTARGVVMIRKFVVK